ncbi:MAG: hypothetical protein WCC10_00370 [Tumebacillaceae bacterium]
MPVHVNRSKKPEGRGSSFGTFGELLQGVGTNDQDFLVTFPITRFATAYFTSEPNQSGIKVSPSKKQKSGRLAEKILAYYGLPTGGILELESNIPIGKGLASSSADLVATARAIDDCFQLGMSEETVKMFLRQIEPTDGVMYPGVVSFYHRQVQLREFLGQLPALTVVSIDEGGEVDTVEFNKIPKPFTLAEKQEYDRLLQQMSQAIRERDSAMIGQIATRSASLNQKLREKQFFHPVLAICQEIGALGVVITHSGTCVGILLGQDHPQYHQQVRDAYDSLRLLVDDVSIYHSWYAEQDITVYA